MFKRCVIGLAVLALMGLAALPVAAAERSCQTDDGWRCVQVNGDLPLNIRREAGANADLVTTLSPGEQGEADYSRLRSADGYDWVPVRFPSGQGWAITQRLDACPSGGSGQQPVLAAVNHDGTLDHDEIAAIARSVVLVWAMRGDRVLGSGTGTITTPEGLILTNAHVVEGADQVVLALLDDINDPPEDRYKGEVVGYDRQIDAALIAIRYDMNDHPVDPATLNLPYMPALLSPGDVFRGDPVYIFGYPGIGDDYLVVTVGSIVSVENGSVDGVRQPVWYRTDAELAPGNSGGLAVNGNGEFVGVPTFVQSESETGGRLGAIRPAQVALGAVQSEALAATTGETAASSIYVELSSLSMEHGAEVDGLPGIRIHVTFTINGMQRQPITLWARFYHDDLSSLPLVNPDAPDPYRDDQNAVVTSAPLIPCCSETIYDDLELFIPYAAFGIDQPGDYPLKYKVEITSSDQSWRRLLSWEFIVYTVE